MKAGEIGIHPLSRPICLFVQFRNPEDSWGTTEGRCLLINYCHQNTPVLNFAHATKTRLDIPDILHHVIVRGIERRDIIADDADKERFVASLSTLLTKCSTKYYAWALMSNHFHLFLMPTKVMK